MIHARTELLGTDQDAETDARQSIRPCWGESRLDVVLCEVLMAHLVDALLRRGDIPVGQGPGADCLLDLVIGFAGSLFERREPFPGSATASTRRRCATVTSFSQ